MVREERGRFDSASSSYMEDQQLLARQLCSDFAFGTRDACNATALQQYCYLSVAAAAPIKQNALLLSGNLADEKRIPLSVIPVDKAAAGMAFFSRRWFHITRSAAQRVSEYWDLGQAFLLEDCGSVLCIPVTLQPASWTAAQGQATPAPRAVGVLTVGLSKATVVDAGLLTGLFLLAHLMAPHVAHFLHAALQRRRNPEAAGSAIDESARALRERGAGCWQGPPNRQSPDTAAGAPAERPKLSSKGLKLMLAFASRLGSHRRGKENSATDCAIVVALSCVLYCFQQLSRLKQSRAVMAAAIAACLIGATTTLFVLMWPPHQQTALAEAISY